MHDPHHRSLDIFGRHSVAVERQTLMERWRMRDPFEVVSRLQEQERRRAERSKEGKQEKAKRELEALFERESDEAEHRDTAK